MRDFLLAACGLALSCVLTAQNTYHPVTAVNTAGRWVRSAEAAAIPAGAPVLLYQAGGATLAQSGGNVGSVTSRAGAGLFNVNRVLRRGGDTLFLTLPVPGGFAAAATQLVVAADAEDLTVTSPQAALPYDGTKGGVLFLAARETLTVGAALSAAGAGFRGGRGVEANSDCNRFTTADGQTYSLGNWRGAPRGEGIGGVPAGQESGRGGGGNDHNSGGAGGANVAAGGNGAANLVSGLFNNNCRGNFPGRAGLGLLADNNRLYFGGGGGAGHANNTTLAGGGNGGGLLVLWARTIDFATGATLDAGGAAAAAVTGDGGGGGGAGGSLLLVADRLGGSPALSLAGGRGADVNNPSDRCFGPGGGGGGGRLLVAASDVTAFSPSTDLSPGGSGLRLGSSDCGQREEPPGPGSTGQRADLAGPLTPFAGFALSATELCGGTDLMVTNQSTPGATVNWQVTPTDPGLLLVDNDGDLTITPAPTVSGTFSLFQEIRYNGVVYAGDTASFTVFPEAVVSTTTVTEADEVVTVSLAGADGFGTIRYDFGDGTVIDTNVLSLRHVYGSGGDYPLTVTLLNDRCGNVAAESRTVSVPEFAAPKVDSKNINGCAPYELTIADRSTGTYGALRWDFPGAFPSSSTVSAPTVNYATPGDFDITLTLLDAVGPDTVLTIPVRVRATPTAVVNHTLDTATVVFIASSPTATEFQWDFGDGNTSTTQNPVHTYADTGTYTVVLLATADNCTVRLEEEITIDVLSDVLDLNRLGVKLFPNPTSGLLTLTGPAEISGAFDLRGRVLRIPPGRRSLDLSQQAAGVYIVRVRASGKVFNVRIRKQ